MRNLWTRALWGGVIGVIVKDAILLLGRGTGWVKTNLLASIAGIVTSRATAASPSGMILGFVIHVLWGAVWALLFTAVVRAFHSRHNIIAGIINGLVVWLLWGLVLPPLGMGTQPWILGTATTVFTLLACLAYGLAVGYAVSEEAVLAR
ncbi:MAG TPA: hypothetical protein GXX30_06780 [Firmicutes bacterium]|nr:hypothetical protein [Candidatus Fermentithermobacillaceae bacterium]